ncbi:MAG TPA: alpha/beta hydrolase [Saprospiraceae bacterium]|nr:alpha/beta hydrolase [Saprospiraceae bacterium]
MALPKRKKLKRWLIRILLFILLLPLGLLVIARTSGVLDMRKPNDKVMAFLQSHQVNGAFDTLDFHNRKVVFLKTARDEKPKEDAMIFVHGSPGSLDAFLDYMVDTTLLARADLITYDRPGFGQSSFGTSMPSLSLQAETLESLMDHLGYKRYFLAGHSYGGPIIIRAAMHHPRHLAGIIIVAGSVSSELEPKATWRKWIDLPLVRQILPTSLRVSNEELMPLKQDLKLIEDDWGSIHVPVSLIHGTKDVLVPFENLNYAKEKLVNADTVLVNVFEGKTHFILWSDRAVVVNEMVKLMEVSDEKLKGKR